jgi:FtsP/CotA-like multicopper oxidase with cupredoxin domain
MRIAKRILTAALPALVSAMAFGVPAHAFIDGLTGPAFSLTATTGYVFTSNATTGGVPNLLVWGYTSGGAEAQLPGPTLIVTQGQQVTIHLTNLLPEEVSIVVPGFKVATGTPLVFQRVRRHQLRRPARRPTAAPRRIPTADRGTFYYTAAHQALGADGAVRRADRPAAAAVSIAESCPGSQPGDRRRPSQGRLYPGRQRRLHAYDREFSTW